MARTTLASRPGAVAAVRPSSQPRHKPDRDKWIFLGPALAVVLALSVFPFVFSFGLTFLSWEFAKIGSGIEFNGLNNFARLVTDWRFAATLRNTLIYVGLGVPLQYAVALGLALLLNQDLPGRKFYRICFMLPLLISPVAVGVGVGRPMFDELGGALNGMLMALGFARVYWISDLSLAFLTITVLEMWNNVPFAFLILLAGVQTLPRAPYEAAQLDGASSWQMFRYITFPLLLPVTITVIFIRGVDSFKMFDIISVMTGGGPGVATESISMYAVQIGLKQMDFSYAATVGWGLTAILVALVIVYLKVIRERVPNA